MGRGRRRIVAFAIVADPLALGGSPAPAQDAAQMRRRIAHQQQIILQQQKQILENQRRLEGQRDGAVERSPVTGQAIDERKLPKGLLSGVIPSCPLGFQYNLFVGCVLYVAH